jgi:NADH-quinone oxidoreductase subunit C
VINADTMFDILRRSVAGDAIEEVTAGDGMPTIFVAPERLVETMGALRDTPELRFALLADITAVDFFPREPRFEIIYLLASLGVAGFGDTPKRLRVKVRVAGDDPHAPSVASVWPAANWAEREVYDLFGVRFDNHPDLRRVLMPEDWEGFPARKDYPVQIKDPVKTYEPLQVSQEQFVANIEANRDRARKG